MVLKVSADVYHSCKLHLHNDQISRGIMHMYFFLYTKKFKRRKDEVKEESTNEHDVGHCVLANYTNE